MADERAGGWVRCIAVEDLQEGFGTRVTVDGKDYAVFIDRGQSIVIENDCPHRGASLSEGRCAEGTVICPWHGWEFCLEDGHFLFNDKVRIGVYPSKIEAGFIWARLPLSGKIS